MAKIGVEYIENFPNARTYYDIDDLTTPYYIAEWFAPYLAQAGHEIVFLRRDQAVNEKSMRDIAKGGVDFMSADRVDLYMILTHGVYGTINVDTGTPSAPNVQTLPSAVLLYDTQQDAHEGNSYNWRFGENCNLEWLLLYGCHTVKLDAVLDHHHIFAGLHLLCGAYGYMYDSWTCCEVGRDTADLLTGGHAVSHAWLDGVTDWFVENHPCVLSVEREETWRNGDPDWENTILKTDHLWGEGITREDLLPHNQYWMASKWCDSGVWDYG